MPARSGSSSVDDDQRDGERADAAEDEPPAAPDDRDRRRGRTGRRQARAAASASGSRSPARRRRPRPRGSDRRDASSRPASSPPSRCRARLRRGRAIPRRRGARAGSRRARGGACAPRHGSRCSRPSGVRRHPEAGQHAEDRRASQRSNEVDRDAGRDRDAQRGEQVHPESRLAERLEDDRREPAEDDVGREAGRVGRPEQRRDGLELGGVPERDDRAGAPPTAATNAMSPTSHRGRQPDPNHRLTIRAAGSRGRPTRSRRARPATRPTAERHPPRPPVDQSLHPDRHEKEGERRRVVAEAVSELDPALAEVHEVDERDEDDGNRCSGDQPIPAEPREDEGRPTGTRGW